MPSRSPDPRPYLPSVLFEVTTRCNLDCLYCYNVFKRPGGSAPEACSFEQTSRTLDRILEVARVRRVTMSGGEPLLADRFVDLVRRCRERGRRVLITSNGNGGDDRTLRELSALGIETWVLPVHSASPAVHDAMTQRPGSHARSLASIDLLRALGDEVTPIVVITRLNVGDVEKTMLFLKDRGCRRIIMNRFNIGGRGIREADRLALTGAEIRAVFERINDLTAKCGLWVSANICTPHCVLDPRDYPRVGFGVCDLNLASRPITLEANGDVRFCNHSPEIMGNIFRDDLREMVSTAYARRWETAVPERCRGCDRWEACAGGCRAAAEQLGRDMTEVDPIAWSDPRASCRAAASGA
jgi:pyrroloquinoline quinone biosynthesis protein E